MGAMAVCVFLPKSRGSISNHRIADYQGVKSDTNERELEISWGVEEIFLNLR